MPQSWSGIDRGREAPSRHRSSPFTMLLPAFGPQFEFGMRKASSGWLRSDPGSAVALSSIKLRSTSRSACLATRWSSRIGLPDEGTSCDTRRCQQSWTDVSWLSPVVGEVNTVVWPLAGHHTQNNNRNNVRGLLVVAGEDGQGSVLGELVVGSM